MSRSRDIPMLPAPGSGGKDWPWRVLRPARVRYSPATSLGRGRGRGAALEVGQVQMGSGQGPQPEQRDRYERADVIGDRVGNGPARIDAVEREGSAGDRLEGAE